MFDINQSYFIYASLAIALFASGLSIYLQLRLKKLFRGKKASDLEYLIAALGGKLEKMSEDQALIKNQINNIEKRLRRSIQKVGIVRFNPFEDAGGNQSFAIALLNEKDSGVVISSLHGREKTMVYAKPIEKRKSTHTLTKEEIEAINKATNNEQTTKN
jgi:hypothetical protein